MTRLDNVKKIIITIILAVAMTACEASSATDTSTGKGTETLTDDEIVLIVELG